MASIKKTVIVESSPQESWVTGMWRPMMGWMYLAVCIMDFIVFPIMWSGLAAVLHDHVTQWAPITLQGAGLFHISMGAILGVTAYGRTKEKLAGALNVSPVNGMSDQVIEEETEIVSKPSPKAPPLQEFPEK